MISFSTPYPSLQKYDCKKTSIENKQSLAKELIFKIESLKSEIEDHKEKINNECAQKIKTIEEKNRDMYQKMKEKKQQKQDEYDRR